VNVAARLQDVAKAEAADLVATREALDAAGEDAARGWRPLTRAPLRGRAAEVEVWRGPTPSAAPSTGDPDRV
jgi:class 3 adenylate cyclase